ADLYALGLVLAEALRGQRVRSATREEEALAIARAGAAVAPDAGDGPLGGVIARATQTEPADRFAAAEEMVAALERASASLGGSRDASAREVAARVATLAEPPDTAEPARPLATAPTAAGTGGPTLDLRAQR